MSLSRSGRTPRTGSRVVRASSCTTAAWYWVCSTAINFGAQRAAAAWRHLEDCDLCARYCRVNRHETFAGAVCGTGERAVVASYGPHQGEGNCLSGWAGSGTIFFSWCNLRCLFCQNWDISQKGLGREVEPAELAAMMLALQAQGYHNITLVSPSHVVAQVVAAVEIVARGGLRLPLVYNTGGYDSPEALARLDGIIDIYVPDMKYGTPRSHANSPRCATMSRPIAWRWGRCIARWGTSC